MPRRTGFFVTQILGERPEIIDIASDDAARKAFENVVVNKILPEARANAPGSMAEFINVGPLEVLGKNVYRMKIYTPMRYISVEQGSGVYAEGGGEPIFIEPKNFKALGTADGHVFANVTIQGQMAQRPIGRAFDKHKHELVGEFFKEVRSDLTGYVASRRRS
jgi:hypothetical protein